MVAARFFIWALRKLFLPHFFLRSWQLNQPPLDNGPTYLCIRGHWCNSSFTRVLATLNLCVKKETWREFLEWLWFNMEESGEVEFKNQMSTIASCLSFCDDDLSHEIVWLTVPSIRRWGFVFFRLFVCAHHTPSIYICTPGFLILDVFFILDKSPRIFFLSRTRKRRAQRIKQDRNESSHFLTKFHDSAFNPHYLF